MRTRLAAVGVLLALAVAACGGGGERETTKGRGPRDIAGVLAAVEGMTPEAREARLRELAKAEGNKLTFYTSMHEDTADAVAKAFEKASGIDVSLFRAGSQPIAQRILAEADAKQGRADVVETAGLVLAAMDPDLFSTYTSPSQARLIPAARHGWWTAEQLDVFVLSWNTKAVSADERPRSWEDLADPRWKGRVALEAGDVEWYVTLRQYWIDQGKTEAEADRLFDAIGANARAVDGHSLIAQLLANGEFDVAASPFLNRIRAMIADGAPVAYEPVVSPMVATSSGVALVRSARHPAAALLMADWLLGDGQAVIADRGNLVTRTDLQVAPGTPIVHADLDALAADYDRWEARYERILGDAPPIAEDG